MTSAANVETVTSDLDPTELHTSQMTSSGNFIAHLKMYPIVITTRQQVLKVPYMDSMIDVMTTMVAPLWCGWSDSLANGTLNQLDRMMPTLKTTQMTDITDCVTKPVVEIVAYTNAMKETSKKIIEREISEPATKVSTEVGKYYQQAVYNENGKNRLLSPMDPIMEPLNDKMIQMVDYWKPDTLKPTSDASTSEIHRGKHIFWNFLVGKKAVTAEVEVVEAGVDGN